MINIKEFQIRLKMRKELKEHLNKINEMKRIVNSGNKNEIKRAVCEHYENLRAIYRISDEL